MASEKHALQGQTFERLSRGRNDAFLFLDPCKMLSPCLNSERFKQPNRHRNRHPTMDAARRDCKIAARRKHHEVLRPKDLTVKNQAIGNLLLENKAQDIMTRTAVQNLGASLHAKLQDDRTQLAMAYRPRGLTGTGQQEIHRRANNPVRIFVKAKAV